ncbi:RimK family alpha-L-glutamate ligase [Candidatus Peregrinibacteria bacterium]|nr:RimK family alpha-L-glutamate ligase [Candidatus Peregrinibacteria bacterium]
MRIAIFYAEERPTLFLFKEAAKKLGFSARLCHFSNLKISIDKFLVRAGAGGLPIDKYDLIFIREIRDYYREFRLLLQFCLTKKIPMLDTGLLQIKGSSKIDGMMRYALNKLPVPKTIFSNNPADIKAIIKSLSLPLVAKENRGRQGQQVYLIKSEGELKKFFDKDRAFLRTLDTPTFLFQKFIPAKSDIRVLVLGGRVLGAIQRQTSRDNEFRHNIALGGTAKEIRVTPKMREIALLAAKLEKFEFAGVDLIQHKNTGEFYILEVNRSPEFEGFMQATGIDVPYEVMKFVISLQKT